MDIVLNNAGLHAAQLFPPLSLEARPAAPSEQSAYYLHRRLQALRKSAMCDGSCPARPFRCNGRLLWPLDQIRTALGVASQVNFA